MGILYLLVALILNAVANFLLKIGSAQLEGGLSVKAFLFNPILLVGIFLFGLNVIFYSLALSKLELSFAYPVMVIGGLLVITALSYFFLKEEIKLLQLVGILFLIFGIFLISKSN